MTGYLLHLPHFVAHRVGHWCPNQLKGGFQRPMKEQRKAKEKGNSRMCRSFWPRTASPAPLLEESLEVLTRCSHQRFTIHAARGVGGESASCHATLCPQQTAARPTRYACAWLSGRLVSGGSPSRVQDSWHGKTEMMQCRNRCGNRLPIRTRSASTGGL